MKEIPLTRGYVALADDQDFERVMAAGPWHANQHHGNVYAQRNIRKPDGERTTEQMHRFILDLTDPKILTDHVDRNGLHNWRSNLRVATNSQNIANSRKRDGSSSHYRGVSWSKRDKKWCAGIRANGHQIPLGCFTDEVEAAKRYDRAAREHHGVFASCNFPLPASSGSSVAA